jgi:hypothetical protein
MNLFFTMFLYLYCHHRFPYEHTNNVNGIGHFTINCYCIIFHFHINCYLHK